MSQATETVLEMERAMWERANDAEVMKGTLADDGIALMEPMGVVPKSKALQMVPAKPWSNLQMTDMVVREISPDCVVLAYHGQADAPDGKITRASVCSTYVRREGRWQMVMSAHHPWEPGKDGPG